VVGSYVIGWENDKESNAMTEAEWTGCVDPEPMLQSVGRKASERKLRLFAVACAWRVVPLIRPRGSEKFARRAIDVALRFADGRASKDELCRARFDVYSASFNAIDHGPNDNDDISYSALNAAHDACEYRAEPQFDAESRILEADLQQASHNAARAEANRTGDGTQNVPSWMAAFQAELARHVPILRDIFGNPFRPVSLSSSWLTSTVQQLAAAIYETRDFARLPILADALEDAGCNAVDILNHLRGGGEHCRGCWALDLVLGKE
jgi:hypothetical protein